MTQTSPRNWCVCLFSTSGRIIAAAAGCSQRTGMASRRNAENARGCHGFLRGPKGLLYPAWIGEGLPEWYPL